MIDNKYGFKFQTNDDKIIDCELILSFYSNKKNRHYLLFTDNTTDEKGSLNVYPYYEETSNSEVSPVVDEEELKIVNFVYDKIKLELNNM